MIQNIKNIKKSVDKQGGIVYNRYCAVEGHNKTKSPENNKPAKREHSSAGRASALQAEGHRFEPCCSHQLFRGR